MTVTRGKKHTFLGMDLYFTKDNMVEITMKTHLTESIEAFGETIEIGATTPAKGDLFLVDKESKPLNDEKAELFHHIVSIQTTICIKTSKNRHRFSNIIFMYESIKEYTRGLGKIKTSVGIYTSNNRFTQNNRSKWVRVHVYIRRCLICNTP